MPRSPFFCLSLLGVSSLLLACQAATHSPQTPPGTSQQFPVASFHIGEQALVARYDLHVDPLEQVVEVSPGARPRAAQYQSLNFDLDIAAFLRPSSFEVRGVAVDAEGDLEIHFSHAHPFAAPILSANPSAQNRADLSYTGRLLLLREIPAGDLPNSIFFDDGTSSIVTDTTLVKNADGYLNPGDLLRDPALFANTFPYVLLADEAKDNRVDVSNGGDPQGNYDDSVGGWQRDVLEVNPIGWTGFDYVHAGQTITNSFTLKKEALSEGGIDLQVAIVIKYSQPAGAPPRTNRALHFPQEPTNILDFAYRLPYAALDASQSAVTGPIAISPGTGSTAPIEVSLRDWDSRGIEAGDADLSDETDPTLIQPGASGAAVATLSAPQLSPSLFSLLPVSTLVSGEPGDELLYTGTVTNDLGTAPLGTVPALVRFVDPEDDDAAANTYRFGTDPNTLVADPARALQVRTYQHIPIAVADPAPVITNVTPIGGIGVSGAAIEFSATASGSPTSWDWDFGGGAVPSTSTEATPEVNLETPGPYVGTVTATNAFGTSDPFPFNFTVSTPTEPTWSKHLIDATGQAGRYSSLVPYGSGFAVTYGVLGTGEFPRVAVTASANPTMASDWTVATLDATTGSSAIYNAAIVHQNRLFVTYYSGTGTQDLRIARANNALPGLPGGFAIHDVDTIGNSGLDVSIAEGADGNLIVAHRRTTVAPGGIRVARSIAPDPTSAAAWTAYEAVELIDIPNASSFFLGNRLIIHNGNPAFSFGPSGTGAVRGVWVAVANTSDPLSKSAWSIHNVDDTLTSSIYNSLSSTSGTLAVCYHDGTANNRFKFARATALVPTSSADWTAPIILDQLGGSNIGQHCILENIAGRLCAVYYENPAAGNGNFKIARALSTTPDTPADWQIGVIETGGAITDPGEFGRALLDVNGTITLTYADDVADDLYFAKANSLW